MTMKRISQETFDEVIRENIEEFEMEKAEAIKEAVAQFRKQGIDLTNIDVTGGEGRQQLIDAINVVQSTAIHCDEAKIEALLAALTELQQSCNKTHICSRRNLLILEEEGGFNALLWHLDINEHDAVLMKVAKVLTDLCSQQESTRDLFEPGGSVKLVSLLRALQTADRNVSEILTLALALGKVVSRCEANKNSLFQASVGPVLTSLLLSYTNAYLPVPIPATSATTPSSSAVTNASSSSVLREGLSPADALVLEKTCHLIRGLSTFDDFRAEMSCAHDNGKFFLKQPGVLSTLFVLAASYQRYPELASASLSTIRSFVNTNEAVQLICAHQIIDLLVRCLRECAIAASAPSSTTSSAASSATSTSSFPLSLIRSVVSLVRNIAADDMKKDALVGLSVIDYLVRLLVLAPYAQDAAIVEHVFGSLAQITLRSPSNSTRLMSLGGAPELLVASMRKFPDRDVLQRQACLTIRNVAGRCPELHSVLLDAGMEHVLRDAGKLPGVVDEAYSALRDLGCDVQYVKVGSDGSIVPAFETFGSNPKLNFRPVYDEADDIDSRVASEAQAPFAAVPKTTTGTGAGAVEDHDHAHGHHSHVHGQEAQGTGHDHAHDHDHGHHEHHHCDSC